MNNTMTRPISLYYVSEHRVTLRDLITPNKERISLGDIAEELLEELSGLLLKQ